MKRDGFTIVEVMIFLAISGLMLTMAIIGSGNLARQARFSDTINSFHSSVQREYEEVVSGVNTRQNTDLACGGATGVNTGTDSCILIGKVLSFQIDGSIIDVRNVTGLGTVENSGTILDQIKLAVPKLSTSGSKQFELTWGAKVQVASRETGTDVTDPKKSGSSRAVITNIGYLRGPNSSRIIPYYFYSSSQAASDVQIGLTKAVNDYDRTTNTKAYICITNDQDWPAASAPVAAIKLGDGQGAAGIDTMFEPSRSTTIPAECN